MNELIEFAQSNLYGLKEYPGVKHNPEIVRMFHEIGHKWVNDDETAWCAAAHSWIHMKMGYRFTGKLNARSWENFGTKLDKPVYGCTVVFWRVNKTSGYGHVGFFIRETKDTIFVLGGNQSDTYNIQEYKKSQLLGYREIPKK